MQNMLTSPKCSNRRVCRKSQGVPWRPCPGGFPRARRRKLDEAHAQLPEEATRQDGARLPSARLFYLSSGMCLRPLRLGLHQSSTNSFNQQDLLASSKLKSLLFLFHFFFSFSADSVDVCTVSTLERSGFRLPTMYQQGRIGDGAWE
jgi:hypothetical protein